VTALDEALGREVYIAVVIGCIVIKVVLGGQWVHNRPFMHPIQPYEFERDLTEVEG